jgi:RND superfamily putative drug exporter
MLYRLGRGSAAHPWRTLLAWLVAAIAVAGLAGTLGGEFQDDYDVPDARAQVGIDQLREHFPEAGYASAQVVVHDADGGVLETAELTALGERLTGLPHVLTVSAPRLSEDADTALLEVRYDVPVTDPDLYGNLEPLEDAIEPTRDAGLQVELGGEVPANAVSALGGTGEIIGVVVALLILVLALGSVVGAGLPIGVALAGLGVSTGGVMLLAGAMDVSTSAPTIAMMVGLGVGIDYALLIAIRHVDYLRRGHEVTDAAGRAVATAGRSVVFAGLTVLISLMGLRLSGLAVYSSFGFATAIAVISVLAAALTLVPVFCRFAGLRILPRKVRGLPPTTDTPTAGRPGLTERWAEKVGRKPLPWAIGAALVMILLALPVLDLRTWPQDSSTQSTDLTTRRAFDLVTEEFGPGANAPIQVVVDRDQVTAAQTKTLARELEARADIAEVSEAAVSPDGALAVFTAIPTFSSTDEGVHDAIASIRSQVPDGVEITGETPYFSDIADLLAKRLWLVIGFVVAVSMLLLMLVFRSVLVPLKAAVMNLLSIGAAYGVMVAVFQWGWGTGLLGLDHSLPVSSWVPMLMFTILFGLSMDYEVFLLSRVRESWEATGDAQRSVVHGLASTGKVISCAAAIMVAVFLGFATEVDVVVKMLGVGMAVAIFLDATVIRMVLVPATMSLLGRWNWWVPPALDRVLPHVRAEVTDADLGLDTPVARETADVH